MKKPLKWIISNSIFMLPLLIILMVSSTLVSVFSVGFALVSKNAISIAAGEIEGNLLFVGLQLGGIIIAEILLKVLISRMNVSFGGRLEMRMREKIFSSVMGKKWSEVSAFHSGEIVNRIRSDASVISSGIMHILPNGTMLITRVLLAICVLFTIDATFTLIICLVAPFLLIFGRLYSKKMKHFHKEVQKSEGESVSYMLENVQNMTVVKAFGNEKNSVDALSSLQKQTLKLRIKRNTWNILANVSMTLLFTGGYAFAIFWGALRISANALGFGDFTAMIQLVNQVQTPFKSMGSLLVNYQNMIASAERILEFENLTDDLKEKKPSSKKHYTDFSRIVLDNVYFSYGGDNILNGASAEIKKGEFVALAGISGAGKSTIMRLLLSLVDPDDGSIYFDGDTKADINSSMRSMFGYVPQGNLLVSGTIADNIAFYSDANEKDIKKAAEAAQLDFAFDLPDGLDTVLGEKGAGLSEGQIQRIAIARALVRKPPVLLLDEATSALDEETEIKLLDALKNTSDTTVIIITHRTKVFDYCDKILTLSDGKLNQTTKAE